MGEAVDQTARDLGRDTAARIDTHEAVCAERYKTLDARLASGSSRMERIEKGVESIVASLKWTGATLVTTLLAIVGALLLLLWSAT